MQPTREIPSLRSMCADVLSQFDMTATLNQMHENIAYQVQMMTSAHDTLLADLNAMAELQFALEAMYQLGAAAAADGQQLDAFLRSAQDLMGRVQQRLQAIAPMQQWLSTQTTDNVCIEMARLYNDMYNRLMEQINVITNLVNTAMAAYNQ